MSFVPLKTYQKREQVCAAAVTLAYLKAKPATVGKRHWRSVTRMHLWPHRMKNAPPWLALGKSVNCAIGTDKDAGYIRISAGGAFKICYAPRGKINVDGEILCILIEPLPDVRDGDFGPDACEYSVFEDDGETFMLIELPDWAYNARASKSAAAIPPPVLPAVAPKPAILDNGQAYKLGAPSHAAVNKARGALGA